MMFGRKASKPVTSRADAPVGADRKAKIESSIPMGLELGGQFAWRLIVIGIVIVAFGFLIVQLREIVVPVLVALLVASLLNPIVDFLVKHRWKRGLAVALAMVIAIAVIGGLVLLVVTQIRSGSSEIATRSVDAFNDFKSALASGPLQIDETQLNDYIDQAVTAIQKDSGVLVTGALSVGTTAGHLLTGFLLVLFSTLFMLIDGKGIWGWIVRLFPRKARPAVDGAGHSGWVTLGTFVKVQIFVAFVDAVGIGLGAFIIGLPFGGFPLVIPIAILVFLASFIPVVGAVLSGAVATLIALVYLGPVQALIMLGVVLLVQQIEGHILQPLIMGSAVKVHPLAVVLTVAGASFIAGIPGALFAVPFIAVLNVMVKYIASGQWRANSHPELADVARTTNVVDNNG